jgi:hypothetical protein
MSTHYERWRLLLDLRRAIATPALLSAREAAAATATANEISALLLRERGL